MSLNSWAAREKPEQNVPDREWLARLHYIRRQLEDTRSDNNIGKYLLDDKRAEAGGGATGEQLVNKAIMDVATRYTLDSLKKLEPHEISTQVSLAIRSIKSDLIHQKKSGYAL